MVNYNDQIVAPWKFDVPKTSIFEGFASRANICFSTGQLSADSSSTEHSIV